MGPRKKHLNITRDSKQATLQSNKHLMKSHAYIGRLTRKWVMEDWYTEKAGNTMTQFLIWRIEELYYSMPNR